MNTPDYVLMGYLVVVPLAYLFLAIPAVQSRRAGRWAGRHRLPSTADVIAQVARARAGRAFALGAGALAVWMPVFVALLLAEPALSPLARWFVLVGAAALGSCLAEVVHALRLARRQPTGPVRVAHATAPRLRTFARPTMVICLRATSVLALAAAVVTAVVTGSATAWAAVLALGLGWLGTELTVTRLVEAPQPSADPVGLAVDDALRGEVVRDLYALPAVMAIIATAIAVDAVITAPSTTLTAGLSGVLAVVAAAVAVSGLVMAIWVQFPPGIRRRSDAVGGPTGPAA